MPEQASPFTGLSIGGDRLRLGAKNLNQVVAGKAPLHHIDARLAPRVGVVEAPVRSRVGTICMQYQERPPGRGGYGGFKKRSETPGSITK